MTADEKCRDYVGYFCPSCLYRSIHLKTARLFGITRRFSRYHPSARGRESHRPLQAAGARDFYAFRWRDSASVTSSDRVLVEGIWVMSSTFQGTTAEARTPVSSIHVNISGTTDPVYRLAGKAHYKDVSPGTVPMRHRAPLAQFRKRPTFSRCRPSYTFMSTT